MTALSILLTLFLVFNASTIAEEYRIVETNSGQIRGVRKTSFLKKVDYYSFKGIPYGKSPTGELRFKVSFQISKAIEILEKNSIFP